MAFPERKLSAVSFKNKYSYILFPLLLLFLDYSAVLLAVKTAYNLRNVLVPQGGVLHLSWATIYVITPFIYLSYLAICDLYNHSMQFWRVIAQIFKAGIYAIATGIMLMYVLQTAATTSRLYIAFLWLFSFFYIVLFRYAIKKWIDRSDWLGEPVLLIGAGKTAALVLKYAKEDPGLNYYFVGYLEDHESDGYVKSALPQLGRFADAKRVIRKTGIQLVLVSAPGLTQDATEQIIYELQPLVRHIAFIPDMGSIPLSTMEMDSLIDGHVVMLRMRNNLKNRWNRFVKFTFDWLLTLVGTIVISPFLLGIALWIRHDSPGPVIFKHKRIGKNGKEFYCYKFRSMVSDADERLQKLLATDPQARLEWHWDFKLKNDPRITKSGKFLRKTSLDELPQIFNVLKGEMSLVGPRPIIADEVSYYGKYIEDYYMVRPGITGMWQTSGRSDTGYKERVELDSWYVRNWNIWFDVVLLWRTMKVVVRGKGAY